jgi:hypothetical protein
VNDDSDNVASPAQKAVLKAMVECTDSAMEMAGGKFGPWRTLPTPPCRRDSTLTPRPVANGGEKLRSNTDNLSDLRRFASIDLILSEGVSSVLVNFVINRN